MAQVDKVLEILKQDRPIDDIIAQLPGSGNGSVPRGILIQAAVSLVKSIAELTTTNISLGEKLDASSKRVEELQQNQPNATPSGPKVCKTFWKAKKTGRPLTCDVDGCSDVHFEYCLSAGCIPKRAEECKKWHIPIMPYNFPGPKNGSGHWNRDYRPPYQDYRQQHWSYRPYLGDQNPNSWNQDRPPRPDRDRSRARWEQDPPTTPAERLRNPWSSLRPESSRGPQPPASERRGSVADAGTVNCQATMDKAIENLMKNLMSKFQQEALKEAQKIFREISV